MSEFGFLPYMPPEMKVSISKKHKFAARDEVKEFIHDHPNILAMRSRKFAQAHADLIIIAQNLSLDKIEVATVMIFFILHLASDLEFSMMALTAGVLDGDLEIDDDLLPFAAGLFKVHPRLEPCNIKMGTTFYHPSSNRWLAIEYPRPETMMVGVYRDDVLSNYRHCHPAEGYRALETQFAVFTELATDLKVTDWVNGYCPALDKYKHRG
ncbi:MAG: hypothetical protein Q9171_002970 [Xanthocarpia ochracea]